MKKMIACNIVKESNVQNSRYYYVQVPKGGIIKERPKLAPITRFSPVLQNPGAIKTINKIVKDGYQ